MKQEEILAPRNGCVGEDTGEPPAWILTVRIHPNSDWSHATWVTSRGWLGRKRTRENIKTVTGHKSLCLLKAPPPEFLLRETATQTQRERTGVANHVQQLEYPRCELIQFLPTRFGNNAT